MDKIIFYSDVVVLRRSYFGSGSGAIYLDSVVCNGSERTLQQCAANPIGVHNCDHSEDAGVRCGGIIFLCCTHKIAVHNVILSHFPDLQGMKNTEIFFMQ